MASAASQYNNADLEVSGQRSLVPMMVAIRTLFYEQAIKMEANIKSQCRQADEWWAQVEAIDAILGKREDEDVDKGKEKALDEVHHPTTSDV